jgi:flagellin
MLTIKNNMMAANAARHLGTSYNSLGTSVERLSSGLRINSAKDDAAGMAVRELIRADVAVLKQGARNAQDGISMLQTMEGAMAVIDNNLIRMKELAEQAATESYSAAQRTIMNAEFAEMASEIERIANATTFNNIAMLNDATSGTVAIHVGTSDTISVAKVDMTRSGLGITTGTAGWSATSALTAGEAATDDAWLTVTDADSSQGATMTIQFDDSGTAPAEAALTVYLADAAGDGSTTYTLEEVRDAINAVSLNLAVKGDGTVQAYTAAEIIRDASGTYQMKINSRTATADSMTWTSAQAQLSNGLVLADTNDTATTLMNTDNFTTAAGAAGTGISIDSAANAVSALDALTTAINTKDSARATFGYKMNRLESTISILDIQSENLGTAESRISDVDVATEMAALTRTQVLSQAGISMLSQANSMPQMALSLLR